MNNFNMNESRNRRNLLNWSGFFPFHSVTNYSSDASKIKIDMKDTFGDSLYINNLHLIPDPLKKNLADSIITGEVKTKTNMASETKTFVSEPKIKENYTADHRADFYPSLANITSFFSGMLSFVSGAMFHKRANSSAQYYECFEQNFDEMAPSLQAWPNAKSEDQIKNGRAHKFIVGTNEPTNTDSLTMTSHLQLINHQSPQYKPKLSPKHSRKVIVEPSSIEDCFEDAFTPEDFEINPNDEYVKFYGSFGHQKPELFLSDAPKIKSEYLPVTEHVEVTKTVPTKDDSVTHGSTLNIDNNKEVQIVSSCEDKISKLKALLQERRRNKIYTDNNSMIATDPLKSTDQQQSEPILIPNVYPSNNKFGNEHNKQKNNTAGDISNNELFVENIVKDINSSDLNADTSLDLHPGSSAEHLYPCNYFDEVTGRFYSTSATDSEDSFQIVFTDSPRSCRRQNLSDCESEDSFIVFEDSPDSCYLSNDVFGDELSSHEVTIDDSDTDNSEESEDSDLESDSGCDSDHPPCKLSHSLTRTIGDLTDNSLYELDLDEVDCAGRFIEEKPVENITHVFELNDSAGEVETKPRGLLIDEKRKLDKKKQQKKTVHFSPHPPKVHVMRVWAFAAKQARIGHWERHLLDRERFKRRIADVDVAVSWVLKPQHRARVIFQRFMPWWNAQKRQELADNKQKEEIKKIAEVNGELNDKSDINVNSESAVANNINNEHFDLSVTGSNKVLNGYNNDNLKKEKCRDIISETVASDEKNRKNLTQTHTDLNDDRIVLIDNNINVLKFGFQGKDIDVSTT